MNGNRLVLAVLIGIMLGATAASMATLKSGAASTLANTAVKAQFESSQNGGVARTLYLSVLGTALIIGLFAAASVYIVARRRNT